MKKIQLRLFDGRRNQNFWFHFCYIPKDLWLTCKSTLKITNLDSRIKLWLKEDFSLEVSRISDLQKAKDHIKDRYSKKYPELFLQANIDRQGWTRVWLVEKIESLLEENNG